MNSASELLSHTHTHSARSCTPASCSTHKYTHPAAAAMTQNFSSITTIWAEAATRNYKEIIDEEFDFRLAAADDDVVGHK